MNPFAKYAVAGLLAVSSAVTFLHYISRGWLSLEGKAYAFMATQENRLVDRLLARLGHDTSRAASQDTLEPLVELKAKAVGLQPDLVKALIDVESSWKVDAIKFEPKLLRGPTEEDRMIASSHGLLQILGSWAKAGSCPGVNSWADLYDPAKNISCGVKILAEAKAKTGSVRKALMAYNGGIRCASQSCPAAEVHAQKVLASFAEKLSR